MQRQEQIKKEKQNDEEDKDLDMRKICSRYWRYASKNGFIYKYYTWARSKTSESKR